MAAQTVADLRTLVARRAGQHRRVALLCADELLGKALQANGCTVLVDPESPEYVRDFQPQVVVAFDGFAQAGGVQAFEALADTAPKAELLFSFACATSASALLGALVGAPPGPTLSEREVRRWLGAAGYRVAARDLVLVPHEATGLSADTEAALRQLLEQVNPDAAADRVLLLAQRGVEPAQPARTEGLLSVVVSSGADLSALEGTVASLLRQQARPLELVVVSSLDAGALERVVEKAKLRANVTVITRSEASDDFARRTNVGLALASGQYLACLEAGDLVEGTHFTALLGRLRGGTNAWALAPVRAAGLAVELPPHFALQTWLAQRVVSRCAWALDTARLGPFPLSFAEGSRVAEAMFFSRLAALFPPSWRPGAPSVDRPAAAPAEPLSSLTEALRARPLRVLTSLDELLRAPPQPQLGDLLKARVARRAPGTAKALERVEFWARRVLTRPAQE